ncbi:MAG: TlpA family protein disulfide reductase [Steroidobacteraceae bacterium]|nr:TlpA family protein disulfide reductase [Steroidobacteraceae bacterium]
MSQPDSSRTRYFVGPLIVLIAGIGGYFAYKVGKSPEPTAKLEAIPAPATPGPAATPPEPEAKKKIVPDSLPDITLAAVDGTPTKLSSFSGRPLMVNFWATWCAPCRREIPLLNRIRAQRKAQNAEIVGVAVDFREDVLKFVQKVPINYPLLIGEEDGLAAAEAFGMGMAFPFSVFADSQGRILTIKVGELHEDEANFAFDRVRDIDNGILTLQAAQAAVNDAFREMATERAKNEASHK